MGDVYKNIVELNNCLSKFVLRHLDDENDVELFLTNINNTLVSGGKLMLSFRDNSNALTGNNRFIFLRTVADWILQFVLEFQPEHVIVTGLLHQKQYPGEYKM